MLKYRIAIKAEGKNVAIHVGEASDAGSIELPIPEVATGGVIVIEWEKQKDD
jgi:hypothetical protein